ncbi:MAG: chromate transporter [Clostridia bacterium]|nr:chromate transporter [Clostridia bacterium]
MIFFELFLAFFKVGFFAFGGAYAAIPIICDVVMPYGWLTDEALSRMIAVSESTPGSIMVNLATYVGASQGGLLGAALATFAVVLPAFIIIVLLISVLKRFAENRLFKAVLSALKPCVIGVILAVGAVMAYENLLAEANGNCLTGIGVFGAVFEPASIGITAVLAAVMLIYKKAAKKRISPILLIIIAAGLGMLVYGV